MWGKWPRTLLLCLLLIGRAAVAAERESAGVTLNLALKTEAGSVDVYLPDGRLLQSLPYDGDDPDEENRNYFAFVKDMDFDGFPDVGILFSQGTNIYYDAWLWRPDAGAFVKYKGMREIPSPDFDPETKRVTSFEHGSAVSYVKTILAWENGKLIKLEQMVQYADDDGKSVVIDRYARGADGELQLLGTETRRPEEMDGCGDDTADPAFCQPDLSGLNFFLDLRADMLDVAALPNGEWWRRQGTPDRSLLVELRRLPALAFEERTVERLIRREWPLAREIVVAPFPALGEKTSYPAFKAEFLDGENEDTRQFVATLIFADEWSFWFVLEASADSQLADSGDADAIAENARLRKEMATLLLGVEDDGNFPPGFGLPVYLVGGDSPLGISVMDALIRIKKVVAPEGSHWRDPGLAAYRYDGPGSVEGRPALLFSFGAGSREKFTAERRFAVDEEGTVYETDSLADGNYWRWEDVPPQWWGEYVDGEKKLSIGNYREGPSGMYFVYSFRVGGIAQASRTVPARGRNASGYGLVFHISEDGSMVTVTADEDADGTEFGEAEKKLVGRYVRQ